MAGVEGTADIDIAPTRAAQSGWWACRIEHHKAVITLRLIAIERLGGEPTGRLAALASDLDNAANQTEVLSC